MIKRATNNEVLKNLIGTTGVDVKAIEKSAHVTPQHLLDVINDPSLSKVDLMNYETIIMDVLRKQGDLA